MSMRFFLVMLAVMLVAPSAHSEKAALTRAELQVMAHYHAANQLEIKLGTLAMQNVESVPVKEYGAMLVKDHTAADAALVALAKKTGQRIPAEKPATTAERYEQAATIANANHLAKLSGAELEMKLLATMVHDHERELIRLDAMVARTKNPELAAMLLATKPVLQHHADHARSLQKSDLQAMRSAPKKGRASELASDARSLRRAYPAQAE
jgi:putative membrane protein